MSPKNDRLLTAEKFLHRFDVFNQAIIERIKEITYEGSKFEEVKLDNEMLVLVENSNFDSSLSNDPFAHDR